jgi:hypothetical protein
MYNSKMHSFAADEIYLETQKYFEDYAKLTALPNLHHPYKTAWALNYS